MTISLDTDYPKLRTLDPKPLTYQGQKVYMLADPLRLGDEVAIIPRVLGPMLALCDGSRSPSTIQQIFAYHFSQSMPIATIERLIDTFDQLYLLDNERSQTRIERKVLDYRSAHYRPAASAGLSYPKKAEELSQVFDNLLSEASIEAGPGHLAGLLSPHIDYPRGGDIYAQVWKRAANAIANTDLFIILGTDHNCPDNPITLTRQNYATPLGISPTEQNIVGELARAIGEDQAFRGELYHSTEHSIELVLTWLQHILNGDSRPIVPILVGSLLQTNYGANAKNLGRVIETIHSVLKIENEKRKIMVIISGDFSHVGPAFGGEPLDAEEKAEINVKDDSYLDLLVRGSPDAFLDAVLTRGMDQNICGTYPAYLGLKLMGEIIGELTGYKQCSADETGSSIVSIGGITFQS